SLCDQATGREFSSFCGRAWACISCTLQRSVSQEILDRVDGQESKAFASRDCQQRVSGLSYLFIDDTNARSAFTCRPCLFRRYLFRPRPRPDLRPRAESACACCACGLRQSFFAYLFVTFVSP